MTSQPVCDTTSSHRLSSATKGHAYKVHCSITWTMSQRTFAAPFSEAYPQRWPYRLGSFPP
eukprot:scaffold70920_cov69-Phaeocystis_antarctica.AAC.6